MSLSEDFTDTASVMGTGTPAGRPQRLGPRGWEPTPITNVRVNGTGRAVGRIPDGVGCAEASDTWPKDAWLGGQSSQVHLNF